MISIKAPFCVLIKVDFASIPTIGILYDGTPIPLVTGFSASKGAELAPQGRKAV